jgi:hypothetical protein
MSLRRAAVYAEIKAYEVCGKEFGTSKHCRIQIRDSLNGHDRPLEDHLVGPVPALGGVLVWLPDAVHLPVAFQGLLPAATGYGEG